MTTTATSTLYGRHPRVLWRDTGEHVVVLALGSDRSEAAVLSGGSAVLWRLLERARRLSDLMTELSEAGGVPPSAGEITSVIVGLQRAGLVAAVQGGD